MNFLELTAVLGLDTKEYDKGMEGASEKASSFGSKVGSVIGTGVKVAGAALAATGAAVVGVSSAFANGITSVASFGDHIDKASQQMGISAEKYQEWDAILQHSGASIDSLKVGMKTLATAVETGNEAFEKIGLTQEELANMNQEEIFAATIEGLQNVESTTERTYLASQLLGRGATELGALLNTSAEETEQMRQRVHELGGVMSDEAVEASAGFQDSLQDLQTSFTGLKNNLLSNFLPSVTTVMDGLTEIMVGNDSEGLGKINKGINEFIDNLDSTMPRLMSIGGRIITSLITSISSNLPKLLSEGSSVLNELIQGIIKAIPSLFESAMIIIESIGNALLDNAELLLNTGLSLLLMLMDGLTRNLPTLIPAIISIIAMISTTLTNPENLGAFIQGALQLIMALADGIVAALPQLIAIVPEVIVNLVQALIENFPMLLETVLYLLGALAVAILESLFALGGSSLDEVTDGVAKIIESLVNWGADVYQWFQNLKDKVVEGVKTFFTNIKNFFTNSFSTIKTNVSNFFSAISNFFTNGFNNIKGKVTNNLNAIKDKFTNIFNNAKDIVKNAIEKIKSFFDFSWELPKLKMPHFSMSGSFSLNPPSIPKISVDWYKKAMNEPYILDDATIFGSANGKLLGGGEAGSELVVGTDKLMGMIRQAVGVNGQPIVINVYGAEGQDIRLLAKEVSKELQNLINDKEKVYA